MKFNIIIYGVIISVFLCGCSVKKDKFINRSYHKLTVKYNVLFNGYEALEKQLADSATRGEGYDDLLLILPEEKNIDFTIEEKKLESVVKGVVDKYDLNEKLSFEKIEMKNIFDKIQGKMDKAFGSVNNKTNKLKGKESFDNSVGGVGFERAEKKALKAIQFHGMNIRNKERNKYIDHAYFLLGQAKYYQANFYESIEAFTYLVANFKKSKLKTEAQIWIAKNQIKIGNYSFAQENLYKLYKESKKESKKIKEKIARVYALSLLQSGKKDLAAEVLNLAIENSKKKKSRLRYKFIQGQLYTAIGELKKSKLVFDEIIKKSNNDTMVFKAKMANVLNTEKNDYQFKKVSKELTEMLEKKKNHHFYNEISYYLAELNRNQGKQEKAQKLYQSSIYDFEELNPRFKARSYYQLGFIDFKNGDYVRSANYMDSALTVLPENDLFYEKASEYKVSLKEVLTYNKIIHENDSILYVSSISKEEQIKYYTLHIEKLKAEIVKKEKEEEKRLKAFKSTFNEKDLSFDSKSGSGFYFYSFKSKTKGAKLFDNLWSERYLVDNWRVKSLLDKSDRKQKELKGGLVKDKQKAQLLDVNYYLTKIPKDSTLLNKLREESTKANLDLGNIYNDQLNDSEKATETLEALLKKKKLEQDLKLDIYYSLYKIYDQQQKEAKKEYYKNLILQYPESKYALFIRFKKHNSLKENTEGALAYYEKTYEAFKEGQDITSYINIANQKYNQYKISLKYKLLDAFNKGRFVGQEMMYNNLLLLQESYPDTIEGKKAKELIALYESSKKGEQKKQKNNIKEIKQKNNDRKEQGKSGTFGRY